jgi:2-keto-3-deoxy-L-rhamnonate aldolase RhmA
VQSAKILRNKLATGQLTVGCIITNHLWLEFLEIAKFAGLDYVIIDAEHVDHGGTIIADACRLGRMLDFPVLLRPPRTDRESIRLAIDSGACGALLPMIETIAQLDEIRDGLWMPPRGQRRPGGHGNWWVPDFHYPTWKTEVEDDFITLMQIESPLGVANARAIAAHEITTALAVGPYDLSARLGVCWQPEDAKLQDALTQICAAAESAQKPMWMIGDGEKLAQQGHRFLCIAEPTYLLRSTLKQAVDNLRLDRGASTGVPKTFVP